MAKLKALECALPAYRTDRKKWRQKILACARAAVEDRTTKARMMERVQLSQARLQEN